MNNNKDSRQINRRIIESLFISIFFSYSILNFNDSLILKSEELYQNQLLINELQKKLTSEQSKNKSTMKKSNADTLDNVDTFLGTKFNEEMEVKIRQIENLNKYY